MSVKKRVAGGKVAKKAVGKPEAPKMTFELPTTKSVPAESLTDYLITIYGQKKIGKTTLTTKFPDSFHLMTEPGAKSLQIYQRLARNWNEFKGWVGALEEMAVKAERSGNEPQFKTVVIDTVDNAYTFCYEYVCKKEQFDHPSEEEWGKGWQAIKSEFFRVFNRILSLPNMGKIFISHSVEREMKTRLGKKYDVILPSMPKAASDLLIGVVDIWAYYDYDGTDRILQILGDDHVQAGHRLHDRFRTPDGERIRNIPMGNSETEAYNNFVSAFNNTLTLSKGDPPHGMVKKHKVTKK